MGSAKKPFGGLPFDSCKKSNSLARKDYFDRSSGEISSGDRVVDSGRHVGAM